jgi:hypothetical protein
METSLNEINDDGLKLGSGDSLNYLINKFDENVVKRENNNYDNYSKLLQIFLDYVYLRRKYKIEKLPVVNKTGILKGLITYRDILQVHNHPNATKDSFGRLLVGAGVGITKDMSDRVYALQQVGVDVICLDSAHGHTRGVINALKKAKKDFNNPRYDELLFPNFYSQHLCRLKEWPDPLMRSLADYNKKIYTQMQGPSEFGIGGNLANWDVKNRLKEIRVPTLMIGAKHDTMDPKAMEEQSKLVQKGRYLYCPNGSHLSMWDDQQVFMKGVITFIRDVDSGKF